MGSLIACHEKADRKPVPEILSVILYVFAYVDNGAHRRRDKKSVVGNESGWCFENMVVGALTRRGYGVEVVGEIREDRCEGS